MLPKPGHTTGLCIVAKNTDTLTLPPHQKCMWARGHARTHAHTYTTAQPPLQISPGYTQFDLIIFHSIRVTHVQSQNKATSLFLPFLQQNDVKMIKTKVKNRNKIFLQNLHSVGS